MNGSIPAQVLFFYWLVLSRPEWPRDARRRDITYRRVFKGVRPIHRDQDAEQGKPRFEIRQLKGSFRRAL